MAIKDIIRQDIQKTTAYHVQETPEGFIKLDAMELPYEFPNEMKQELAKILAQVPLRLYPDINHHPIVSKIKNVFKVPTKAEVITGNGSDELIQLLTLLVAKNNAKVLSLDPSFAMYKVDAELYGMQYISVDCDEELQIDFNQVFDIINQEKPDLIFIAYPNNPTGIRFERSKIEKIITESNALVVIDEAYGAFASDSFLDLAGSIDNLVVVKTFSKIGFAGIRLGFASGHPSVMQELKKITPPYNMNQLTLATADYILEHFDWVTEKTTEIKYQREIMLSELESIEFLEVYPSETNFLMIRTPDAKLVFDTLYKNKILVKNFHGKHPMLDQCVRITIGTPEQNSKVIGVIKSLFESLSL
ncbi:histidinol-phosphate transaminase [Neisseriaceae bacterium PsAf]|nr:histidinol-phosphate transaminase [Neisseriaceae bacterium PsAf]MCV2503033.1 histidinol-phosphate transaminase [Neisseriaceae bacterium]